MKEVVKMELGLLTREELHAFLELSTEVAYDAGLSDGNDGYVKGHIDGRSDGYTDGYSDGYNDCNSDFLENLQ
jgi:hypothetical protein